jgi:hypothetical protein
MVPPPSSVQAVRELAGSVWVPSWAGSVRVTRWRYIIYIEWVLYSQPHHLPRQPTGVDRSWTAAPWAQRRQGHPYIHLGHPAIPSTALGLRALPRFDALARTPASEPHHPPRQPRGLGDAQGPPGTRVRRRLLPLVAQRPNPSSLIASPPRRLPSVHLSPPTGECSGPTWDRLPGAQSPSPLARGGPPRGQALPTPRARRPGPRVPSRVQPPTTR